MRWLRLSASGVPVGSCDAPDLRSAQSKLGWSVGMSGYVQSAVSYACGYTPKVAGRCTKCFREAACDPCAPCARKLERKAAGMRKVRGKAGTIPSGQQLASARNANVWNGIVRRSLKRGEW